MTEISPVGGAGCIASANVSALDPKKIHVHPVLLPSLYQGYLLGWAYICGYPLQYWRWVTVGVRPGAFQKDLGFSPTVRFHVVIGQVLIRRSAPYISSLLIIRQYSNRGTYLSGGIWAISYSVFQSWNGIRSWVDKRAKTRLLWAYIVDCL
jgi:hypothetical protein